MYYLLGVLHSVRNNSSGFLKEYCRTLLFVGHVESEENGREGKGRKGRKRATFIINANTLMVIE